MPFSLYSQQGSKSAFLFFFFFANFKLLRGNKCSSAKEMKRGEKGDGEGRGEGRPMEKRRAVITVSYSRDNKGPSRAW